MTDPATAAVIGKAIDFGISLGASLIATKITNSTTPAPGTFQPTVTNIGEINFQVSGDSKSFSVRAAGDKLKDMAAATDGDKFAARIKFSDIELETFINGRYFSEGSNFSVKYTSTVRPATTPNIKPTIPAIDLSEKDYESLIDFVNKNKGLRGTTVRQTDLTFNRNKGIYESFASSKDILGDQSFPYSRSNKGYNQPDYLSPINLSQDETPKTKPDLSSNWRLRTISEKEDDLLDSNLNVSPALPKSPSLFSQQDYPKGKIKPVKLPADFSDEKLFSFLSLKTDWLNQLLRIRKENQLTEATPELVEKTVGQINFAEIIGYLRDIQRMVLGGSGKVEVFENAGGYDLVAGLTWNGLLSNPKRPGADTRDLRYICVGFRGQRILVNGKPLERNTAKILQERLLEVVRNPGFIKKGS